MPPPNDHIVDAIEIDLDSLPYNDSQDTTGGDISDPYPNLDGWPDTWYKLVPTTDITVAIQVECTAGDAFTFEADLYTNDVAPSVPTMWSQLGDLGFYLYDPDSGPLGRGVVLLEAGNEYYLNVYLYKDSYEPDPSLNVGTFTLTIEAADSPPNDNVVDAITIPVGGGQEVTGTTVDGTVEADEFADWDDSGTPSVWYKVVIGGPGVFTYSVESLTDWAVTVDLFFAPGAVGSFSDLENDGNSASHYPPDDPETQIYGGFSADHDPITGGQVFYFRVSGGNGNGLSDTGTFRLTVSTPGEALCIDAVDIISGSGSVSVVSGAVRETQIFDEGEVDPYESWIADMDNTLVFQGSDITDTLGFYAVTIYAKNATDAFGYSAGIRRNGLPMLPGSFIEDADGSSPTLSWMTAPPGSTGELDDPFFVSTQTILWRLPIHPDDTFGIVVALMSPGGTSSIDIQKVCFTRVADAVVAPLVDMLDVPDYPLGYPGWPDAGIFIQPDPSIPEPTNSRIETWGCDMCVTDDGRIWVLHMQEQSNYPSGGGETKTGPVLQMWDGANWNIINDDIMGFGVRRFGYGNPANSPADQYGPYSMTMDTDGTDLWMAWAHHEEGDVSNEVANGHGAAPQQNGKIIVHKYDVSSDTFTQVGPLLFANTTQNNVRTEAGSFDTGIHLKLAPNGDIWVGFCDWIDNPLRPAGAHHQRGYWLYDSNGHIAYAAKFNGSDWDVYELPLPAWFPIDQLTDIDLTDNLYESENINVGGSGDTFDGASCISTTATGSPGDSGNAITLATTPPTGGWSVSVGYSMHLSGSGTGRFVIELWIDGEFVYTLIDQNSSSWNIANQPVHWSIASEPDKWTQYTGSEQLEIRAWRSGVVDKVYLDEVILYPNWICAQGGGGRGTHDSAWVESAQYHVPLVFNNEGNPNWPRAVYAYISNVPLEGDDLDPELGIADYRIGFESGSNSQAEHRWSYSEFNGTKFVRIKDFMIEDEFPEYAGMLTRESSFNIVLGQQQEGIALHHDPDTGRTFLGSTTMLHFSGQDMVHAFELTQDDVIAIPGTIRAPGVVTQEGYVNGVGDGDQIDERGDGAGFSWYWDVHVKSIVTDYRGNIWMAWFAEGNYGSGEMIIAQMVNTGTGGWITGAKTNMMMPYAWVDHPGPVLCTNPAKTKIYMLAHTYLVTDDPTYTRMTIFGVWEIDIIEDDWLPLTPVVAQVGEVNMNIRTSKRADVQRLNQ